MIKRNFFVNWFKTYGRSFPWREKGTTAFEILITEMLLRQTRASNVATIWKSFVNDYNTPESIIRESNDELVLRLKQLGFGQQKVEALKAASGWLIEKHGGMVPENLEALLSIPHVGNYAARATLCFAFGKKVEIVDTNVLRLFARFFGIEPKTDIRRSPQAWQIARSLLPREVKKALMHNYGILDFTADICRSGKPRCEICPLNNTCEFVRKTRNNEC